jgi:type I restriction enzyme S subunit
MKNDYSMCDQKMIPHNWVLVISSAIIDVRDGTHDTPRYVDNGIPLITSKNLKERQIDFANISLISLEDHNKISDRSGVEKGDVLFAMIGTIGNPAIIKTQKIFSIKNVGLFKRNENVILSKFLQFFLSSKTFEHQLQSRKLIKGTTQKFITLGNLRDIIIPLPPLKEQQHIVLKLEEFFSSLDKGIESLKTAQQQLKVYRQAVLKYAFKGKLTNKNVNGELPEGWEWVTVFDIVEKKSIKVLPSEMPDAKFIGMDCIEPHSLKPTFTYNFGEFKSAGNYFEKDQVLYGRMRPYLNKVYKSEFVGTCSGEFIILSCKADFKPDLLKYIFHSKEFVRYSNNKTSGDRPRVTFEDISDYPIVKPPLEEQQSIIKEIESRLSVCDKIEESIKQSLAQAEALRQSILKKAFEGKLVPQDPNDEPASKLLERIKAEKDKAVAALNSTKTKTTKSKK